MQLGACYVVGKTYCVSEFIMRCVKDEKRVPPIYTLAGAMLLVRDLIEVCSVTTLF